MQTFDHLQDGYLRGWPGRTRCHLTSGGTRILYFEPSEEDQIIEIEGGKESTIRREGHHNTLMSKRELGWNYGDLSKYYPDFIYEVLQTAQKRVIACLRGENTTDIQ